MKISLKYLTLFGFAFFLTMPNAHAQLTRSIDKSQERWLNWVGKKPAKLSKLYLKQALLYTQDDVVFGEGPIRKYVADHQDFFAPISSYRLDKQFEHSDRKMIDLGMFMVADDNDVVTDSLHYVTALRKIGQDWLRELDIILPAGPAPDIGTELDGPRSEWVKYANGSDPKKLVETLFAPDATYLNNSEMSRGYDDITKKFSFVSSPNFHITLQAKLVVPVDDRTAIDIGNWITSEYVGYYTIVWKKDDNDAWKISLYFNY